MNKKQIDWSLAESLRSRFLSETPSKGGDYWESEKLIALYDDTFAQRIGWKWDSVLEELLGKRKLTLPSVLVDWGAGTAIASRRCLSTKENKISHVHLRDRSPLVLAFAKKQIAQDFPNIAITTHTREMEAPTEPFGLILSHVLGELTSASKQSIQKLARQAAIVLWVEPGTPELSRELISFREELRAEYSIIAPCPHANQCGLLAKGTERHWCHFFASPPQEVFHSAFWREFSKRLRIDLRSLPVSFLALQKPPIESRVTESRMIGRARDYKGLVKALVCESAGDVVERSFVKSKNRELCERLLEGEFWTKFS